MRKIAWTEQARADIRRLDRQAAMRVFVGLHRFVESGEGDVRKLKGESGELRLRIGDYRVRFSEDVDGTLRIHYVRHRRDVYR